MNTARHRSSAPRKSRILVVDDHPIVREGIARLVEREPDLEVCSQAETAKQALALAEECRPDLAIVDLALGEDDGLTLIRDLRKHHPDTRVLVLSIHSESFYVERALRAGAIGYVKKQEAARNVIAAIRSVLAGGVYLSEVGTAKLAQGIAGEGEAGFFAKLTDRELQVLRLLGSGLSTRQIAERLDVSVKTIDSHRENLKRKLQLASGSELVRYSISWLDTEQR